MQKLAKKKHHEGIYLSNVKSYRIMLPYEAHMKIQPKTVMEFGAMVVGSSLTSHYQIKSIFFSNQVEPPAVY